MVGLIIDGRIRSLSWAYRSKKTIC